jgi:hypothetical protein
MEYLAKGYRDPQSYFSLFRNSVLVGKGSHTWFGKHIVTLFDDHDQVRKGNNKARFCGDTQNRGYAHLPAVVALNLTTMGIPCLFYGTENKPLMVRGIMTVICANVCLAENLAPFKAVGCIFLMRSIKSTG